MFSLDMIKENKISSVGGVAIVFGLILIVSGSTVKVDSDTKEGSSKKRTLMALGGTMISVGVLAAVFEQFTKRTSNSESLSSSELASFQERVSAAANNLRKSIEEQSSSSKMREMDESTSELAARASAQISSFIQNYA